jgi:acetyl esterase
MTYPSYAEHAEHAEHGLLTAADMAWFWDKYVPSGAQRADPPASPLRASLVGAPSALVVVAEYDPLRDEGLAYAERLRDVGVAVNVRRYEDAFHGFLGLPGVVSRADECIAEIAGAVRRAVSASTGECSDQ